MKGSRKEALHVMDGLLHRFIERFGPHDRVTINCAIDIGQHYYMVDDAEETTRMGLIGLRALQGNDYQIDPPVSAMYARIAFLLSRGEPHEQASAMCDLAYQALLKGYPEPGGTLANDWRDPDPRERQEHEDILKLIFATLSAVGRTDAAAGLLDKHPIRSLLD
jgi:hypothetical protein